MSLHDVIQQDASKVFCQTSDFAETVTYYPRTGDPRHIDIVLIRDAFTVLPEDGDSVVPVYQIHVANTTNRGISSSELDLGGDVIEFGVRIGRPLSKRTVTRLIDHDEGMLTLECQ